MDGSLCGTWASSDAKTKAYIRGEITTEGNYRIEVKANPGAAQVQKSSIFKVKHENVVTDLQLNADNGIGAVEINNMPAGYYNITATKAGGGVPITTYNSSTSINVTQGNTSGVNETLYIRLTGETKDGTPVYWPHDYSEGSYNSGEYYHMINIPSTATTKEDVASIIKQRLNRKEVTLTSASGSNPVKFTLSASTDENGNCIITSSSTEGKLSLTQMRIAPGVTSEVSPLTNTEDVRVNVAELQGRVEVANSPSGETIDITVTYDNNPPVTRSITVPAGTNVDDTAALMRNVNETLTIGGRTVTLKGGDGGADNYYTLTAKAEDNKPISITTTASSGITLYPNSSTTKQTYTTKYEGSITHDNSSSNVERAWIYVSDGNRYGYIYTGYPSSAINTDIPAGSTKEDIAEIIYNAVRAAGSVLP